MTLVGENDSHFSPHLDLPETPTAPKLLSDMQ